MVEFLYKTLIFLEDQSFALWIGWPDGMKNPPPGRVLVLAFAVVDADHMFGLGKEEPAGSDDARDMGDHSR